MRFEPLTVSHRVVGGPPARVPRTVMIAVASLCGYCGFLREMHPLNSDLSAKKKKRSNCFPKDSVKNFMCGVYLFLERGF